MKSVTVSIMSPSICHEVMGPDAMIFIFLMLSFKAAFSLYSFTFIKRLFSSSLLKVKEESEKVGLNFYIQKTKIMACGSITSWQIDGETMKTVRDFFLDSKIPADGDCTLTDTCSLAEKL